MHALQRMGSSHKQPNFESTLFKKALSNKQERKVSEKMQHYLGDSLMRWAEVLLWLRACQGIHRSIAQLLGSFHLCHQALEGLLHLQHAQKANPQLIWM